MKSGIRILTSCLLIAVLCILALSSMAYVLYGDYSRRQTEEGYLSDFTYSVTRADAFPESIASSARQLAELSVFTDAAQQGALRMTGVMEQLAEFTDTGYQPALMLQGQPQYVYTPDGKIAYTQYEEQLYEYGINGDMSQIFTTMLKSDNIKLRRVNESGVLCYTMAVGNRWDTGRGTLLVLMDETLLTSCFYGEAEGRRCDVYLLLEDGTFLCRDCCREGVALTAQEVNGGSVNGINYKTIGGKRLVIAKAASSTGLFSYITVWNEGDFFAESNAVLRKLLSIIALVLLFSVILAMAMAYSIYKPLGNAYKKITGRRPTGRLNELDAIVSTYEQARENILELEGRQSLGLELLRKQMMQQLLNSRQSSRQSFENCRKSLELSFDRPYWCAMFVSLIPDAHGVSQAEGVLLALDGLFLPDAEIVFAERRVENGVGLILNFACEDVEEAVRRNAGTVLQCITAQMNNVKTLGVGTVERDAERINLSYYRAAYAAQHAPLSFMGSIAYFEQMEITSSIQVDTLLLSEGMEYGNSDVALTALETAIEQIKSSREYTPIIRLMYGEILNTIIACAEKQGFVPDKTLLLEAADTFSPDEFSACAQKLIIQVCRQSAATRHERFTQDRTTLFEYITSHYRDNSLSLQEISEKTHISMSKINLILKEHTGCSYVQYLWLLRRNEAKRLLRETDDSIQSIVTSVGYIDISSFMRKFKAAEGISPGQYRQQYRA